MEFARNCGFALLITSALAACGGASIRESDRPQSLSVMEAVNANVETTLATKVQRLSSAWTVGFAALFDDIQAASVPELIDAFTATDMLLYYAGVAGDEHADQWLDRLVDVHAELDERGAAGDEQAATVFQHLVTFRRFDDARALRGAVSSLHVLTVPTVHMASGFDANAPAVMTPRDNGEWDVTNISLGELGMVAVVGCPTSSEAVAALASDAALMRSLRERGVVWLSDASATSGAAVWNAAHPGQPMQVAWRNGAWREIGFESMPAFHYLQGGNVVERYDGWDPKTTPERVRRSLEALKPSS